MSAETIAGEPDGLQAHQDWHQGGYSCSNGLKCRLSTEH